MSWRTKRDSADVAPLPDGGAGQEKETDMSETVIEGREAEPDRDGQAGVNANIAAAHRQDDAQGLLRVQPRLDFPAYRSSLLRHPTKDLRHATQRGIELVAPCFGHRDVDPLEADLTIQHGGEPIGERARITGRVLDGDAGRCAVSWSRSGRPIPLADTSTRGTSTPRRSTRSSPGSGARLPATTAPTHS